MATAYVADTYADQQISGTSDVAKIYVRPFSFSIANTTGAAGFALNDTLSLCPIPYKTAGYGVLVLGFHVEVPALDTGATVITALGDTNAASNAFQATFVTGSTVGQSNHTGLMTQDLCLLNNAIVAGIVRGVVPKQYTQANVYTTQGSTYPAINFQLKITTAPGTATTSGTIKGYLMMMPLMQSSVTF